MLNLRALRRLELGRRVAALPEEVLQWRRRSEQAPPDDPQEQQRERDRLIKFQERFVAAHFSQLLALQTMMRTMDEAQNSVLATMDPSGDVAAFTSGAMILLTRTVLAQQFWDYFRDKFELRFSPKFGELLWTADTVAYDCYTSVMQAAVAAGIVAEGSFREPPLTYLDAETSPLTWLRSQMPVQNGAPVFASKLPFAVIELPWEQMENLWELLALHHEVGHDLERDLGIEVAVRRELEKALSLAGVADKEARIWTAWRKEIFADLVGLQLGGPAFARSLASIVLLPESLVKKIAPSDPHPTHYLRIRLCVEAIKLLGGGPNRLDGDATLPTMKAAADELNDAWSSVYGANAGEQLEPLLPRFDLVIRALMDTPYPELKQSTVRSLMPYQAADENLIQAAGQHMLGTGAPPGVVKPRFVISAGHVAIVSSLQGGYPKYDADLTSLKAKVDSINGKIVTMVAANAPQGLRAGGTTNSRRDRWRELACEVMATPFQFQGDPL